jgi:cholesterol oxidase
MGVADTHHPATVGVFLGDPGMTVPDPYFGGAGPVRRGCVECGGCMVGCRFHAKNTLDHNYLYLAERAGAVVHADTEVVDVEPLARGGFEITTRTPGYRRSRGRRTFVAGQVVFSAGALGTTRLLLGLRDRGRLPHASDRLGHVVRTNSGSLIGAVASGTEVDYSQGVAITSSIEPEPHTRIEPVRYSPGSNAMGLIATILVPGGGRLPQPVRFLLQAIRHPVTFLRTLSVRRWSERTVILLVMQSLDNSIRLFLRRRAFGTRLTSGPGHGDSNPRWLPVGHRAARIAAKEMDGFASGSINESLLRIPITAHILGGATIGAAPERGVVDPYHRMFGHPGLHVVDGSALPANLGSNPALTITALAERATSMWPNKGDPDPRPPLGAGYRPVAPVLPHSPAIPSEGRSL